MIFYGRSSESVYVAQFVEWQDNAYLAAFRTHFGNITWIKLSLKYCVLGAFFGASYFVGARFKHSGLTIDRVSPCKCVNMPFRRPLRSQAPGLLLPAYFVMHAMRPQQEASAIEYKLFVVAEIEHAALAPSPPVVPLLQTLPVTTHLVVATTFRHLFSSFDTFWSFYLHVWSNKTPSTLKENVECVNTRNAML